MADEPEHPPTEPEKEIALLTEQDAVMAHMMDGRRILAEINLRGHGMKILDSGTADGLFLRSIQPDLIEPYTLLGYDIVDDFFPKTAPPHTTFATHDIASPWPDELHGTCDLVHQRFRIPGATTEATAREIVGHLCQLVKPGGWIQLVEVDVLGTVHGPAMRDAWAATSAVLTAAGATTDYARSMAGWLEEEGFELVRSDPVDLNVGARYHDAEWGTRGANVLLEFFKSVADACETMKLGVPDSILKDLPERVEKELMDRGGAHPIVFATGRKPAA